MIRRFVSPLPFLALLTALASVSASADPSVDTRPFAKLPGPLAQVPGPAGTDVAFSRDSQLLLTAGGAEARVWDAETYKPVTHPLKHGAGDKLFLAALSPDGKLVLTVAENEAWVWDVAKGERVSVLRHGRKIRSASFGPDGSKVLTAGDDGASRVWTAGGRELAAHQHLSAVVYSVFSPDGSKILTVVQRKDGEGVEWLHLWDSAAGKQLWRVVSEQLAVPDGDLGDRRYRRLATFSPDGTRVAAAAFRDLLIRDARDGRALAYADTVDHAGATQVVAYSPDGKSVVAGTQMGCVLYDVPTEDLPPDAKPAWMKPAQTFADWVAVDDVGYSGDGRFVFTATRGNSDGTGVWRVSPGWPPRLGRLPRLILPYREHFDEFPAVALRPDGKRAAISFASDGFTGIWDVPDQTKQP